MRRARPLLNLASRGTQQRQVLLLSKPVGRYAASSAFLIRRTQFSTKPPIQPVDGDKELEKVAAQKKLKSDPEHVSTQSSVRHVFEPNQVAKDPEEDMMKSLKHDVGMVKDTVALKTVPQEAYTLGLAGTIPYLFTSLSTVYLSWDLTTEWPSTSNFLNSILMSHDSASYWLQILEPLQVGYGAVLISFLGAIHWGLEFAEHKPDPARTRFRYGLGVLAPIVAWPTLLFPIEAGLTTQFLAFAGLYLADARATARGWAPPWYQTYRFVLTTIVGSALFISLVMRAKIGQKRARLSTSSLQETMGVRGGAAEHYGQKWQKLETEEKERIRKEKKAEEKRAKEEEQKKKGEELKAKARGQSKEDKKTESEKEEGDDNEEKDSENGSQEEK